MVIKEETEKSLTCMDNLLKWFSDCVLRVSRTEGNHGVTAKAALGQELQGRKERLRSEVSDPQIHYNHGSSAYLFIYIELLSKILLE